MCGHSVILRGSSSSLLLAGRTGESCFQLRCPLSLELAIQQKAEPVRARWSAGQPYSTKHLGVP